MASVGTRIAETLSGFSNIPAVIAHGALITAACFTAVFGGDTEYFVNQRRELSKRTAKHAQETRKLVQDYHDMDAQEKIDIAQQRAHIAETEKESAAKVKPLHAKEAEHKSETAITEDQSRSDIANIQAKTKAEINILRKKAEGIDKQTAARERQEIVRAEKNTDYALQQQETTHRTILFSNLQTHLEKMTELTKNLKETTDNTTGAARNYEENAQDTLGSIEGLTEAMEDVIAVDLELQQALDDFDDTISVGQANAEKEHEIRQLLRQTISAEIKLETDIATTRIQHQSDLRLAFAKDLGEKNRSIDTKLSEYSHATLAKLSELVQNEIDIQQQEIEKLEDPEAIEACEAHLNKLLSFQKKVDTIALDKEENAENISTNRFN